MASPRSLGLTQLTFFITTLITASLLTVLTAKSAPAPAVDCSSLVLNMADCLSFVSAGSTTTKPEGTCCAGLKTVLKTDAECLCEAYRNSAQLGVTLNVTKAFSLPSACHVSAPSVSNCGLSPDMGNAAAPAALSPLALSPSSVSTPPSSSIGADEFAPSPSPGGSGPGSASGSSQSLVITSVHVIWSIILCVLIY